jgi:hypothetical protein
MWIHINFKRLSCGLLSNKIMKNIAKWLKNHFQNGSIYFPFGSFPKKGNILGGITTERYDHIYILLKLQFLLFFGLFGLLQAT